MSELDHILLYCIMLLLAYLYDRQYRFASNSKLSIDAKIAPFTMIFLGAIFVITEGLRYGRGVDQTGNYGPFYLHCMNAKTYVQDFETMFVWLNQFVYKIDPFRDTFVYGSIFLVYALIFFICLYIYYKDKRMETKLFLVFAILATNYITEWTIRQGVSFSFILLGYHFLEQKKWKSMVCAMLLGFSIHHGNILAICLPIAFYFFLNKKPLPWKVTVPLFVLMEYTMQVSIFQNYVQLLSSNADLISLTGNFSGYMQDNTLTHEAEISAEWARGSLTQLLTVLFYSSLIFIGNEICKRIPCKMTYIYNSFVIAILFFEPFRLAGSLTRLFNVLSCLWFIPLAYAIFNYKDICNENKIVKWAIFSVALYLITFYGRYIFLNPTANYVWNL